MKKKCFRRHFRENWQKTCHVLQILAIMDVGLGEGMNTSKKKKLGWKSEGEGVFSQRPKSVKHGKSYLLRVSQWLSVVSLKFKGYLEKFILYPDVMLQLLKKLKLYSKLGPDTVHKAPISFHIKTYLWSLVDYQHLQKYFYNWNIKLNYYFICKINIKGNFMQHQIPIFKHHNLATSKNCKWFKNLCAGSPNDHVAQSFEVFSWWQNKSLSFC